MKARAWRFGMAATAMRPTTWLLAWLLLGWSLVVAGQVASRGVAVQNIQPRDAGYRICVNCAEATELELLPDVGPAIARHIIAYREQFGPISEPLELERVHQIGPVRRQRLEPWVRFGE